MTPLPEGLPTESITTLVEHFRAGTIKANKKLVATACWNIGGYGLNLSIDGPKIFGSFEPEIEDSEAINALEQLTDPQLMQGLPINVAVLARWAIRFAMKVVAELV